MSIELTDATRYALEKENATNVILAANRKGIIIEVEDVATALNVPVTDAQRFLNALKSDGIIK